MLGILLIYFIGKSFYSLADEYNRSKWGFTILGIAVYYGSTALLGVILALLANEGIISIDFDDTVLLTFIALPVGLLSWIGLYQLLKFNWSKNPKGTSISDVLDEGIFEDKE